MPKVDTMCNTTGSSSDLQISPIPTDEMIITIPVSMNSKPKSVVQEITEIRPSKRLDQKRSFQHESITDDYRNQSKYVSELNKFKMSNETKLEILKIPSEKNHVKKKLDKSDDFEGLGNFFESMETAPSADLSNDLHEQLQFIMKNLEKFERDFYLLLKRIGNPSEKVIRMNLDDLYSELRKKYSESIIQSIMGTLSPMIPDGFKDNTKHNEESSSNEDIKLTNEMDLLRKDIVHLINELDNLIGEFPKTFSSLLISY